MDTQDMLLAILKADEEFGYDLNEDLEFEYQDILKRAKAFNEKIINTYNLYKEQKLIK